MGRVKRIWYLSPMRAAKVQASLRIHAVSPETPLLAHTSSESRGTSRQKARSLAPLNGWACAVKICHDGMLEDTNLLGAPQIIFIGCLLLFCSIQYFAVWNPQPFLKMYSSRRNTCTLKTVETTECLCPFSTFLFSYQLFLHLCRYFHRVLQIFIHLKSVFTVRITLNGVQRVLLNLAHLTFWRRS